MRLLRWFGPLVIGGLLLLGLNLIVTDAGAATAAVAIDLEGLQEGASVERLESGRGISGDPVDGYIGLHGYRRADPNRSRAMVFDATCRPGGTSRHCTGQDSDLFLPAQGNLLIVSEDGDRSDPDDSEDGVLRFDLTTLGAESVTLRSLVLADTDSRRPVLTATRRDGAVVTRRLTATGNNRTRTITLDLVQVTAFEIDMRGAGAIDDLVLEVDQKVIPTTTTTSMPTTTTSTPSSTTSTTTSTTQPPAGPALDLAVFLDGVAAGAAPGPMVDSSAALGWSYQVTNIGTENLWALYLWHDGLGRAECADRSLAPGETVTCELAATAGAGDYAEMVYAWAWDDAGAEAAGDVTAHYTIDPGGTTTTTTTIPSTTTTTTTIPSTTTTTLPPSGDPALDLVVRTNGEIADTPPGPTLEVGATVDWTYEITNTGGENLWALYLWHDGVGRVDCPDRSLAPSEIVVCEISGVVAGGQYAADVTAQAWDTTGVEVSDTLTTHYYSEPVIPPDPQPALDLETFVAGFDADSAPGPAVTMGTALTFRYQATNIGNVDLWALWLRDDAFGTITTCPTRHLAPGDTVVCEVTVDSVLGPHAAAATASAWDEAGTEAEDADFHHYTGVGIDPRIEIESYVGGFDADTPIGPRPGAAGDTIQFTYVVSNTGGTPLGAIVVTDDRLGDADCPGDTLDPGETMTCTAEEIARVGEFGSAGRVEAYAGSQRLTDSDPLYWHIKVTPRIHSMVLEVSVNGHDADDATGPLIPLGGSVRFTYTATYTGNNVVNAAEIRDPGIPDSLISCSGGAYMRPGDRMRCTATIQAGAGQYASTVTVVAWDNDGVRVSAGDTVHYYGMP